jgi:hypothetical protein
VELENLQETGTLNAILSWAVIGLILATGVERLLEADFLWAGLILVSVAVAVYPSVRSRSWESAMPVEMLILALLPFGAKAFGLDWIQSYTLNYLSISALALMAVAELEEYTSLESTDSFSVLLVSVTTVALAGAWAVVRWLSDIYLGTAFIESEHLLMWEFTAATFVGLVSGSLYTLYFERRVDESVEVEA